MRHLSSGAAGVGEAVGGEDTRALMRLIRPTHRVVHLHPWHRPPHCPGALPGGQVCTERTASRCIAGSAVQVSLMAVGCRLGQMGRK